MQLSNHSRRHSIAQLSRATHRAICENLEKRRLFSADPGEQTVNIYGTAGSDTIYVNVSLSSDTRYVDSSVNGDHNTENSPFFYYVNIYGQGGDDKIIVQWGDVGTQVYVYGGNGNDTITFGEAQLKSVYHAFGGAGKDKVILNRSQSYDFDGSGGFSVDNNGVALSPGNSTRRINMNSVETFDLLAGGKGETINVNAVPEGRTVNVWGRTGNDTFNVGNGNIEANIKGDLNLYGGEGTDTTNFNDAADTGADTYQLISGIFDKPGLLAERPYFGTEIASITGNNDNNTFNIHTSVNTTLNLYGNKGADTFKLGGGDMTDSLFGVVNVHGYKPNQLQNFDNAQDIVSINDSYGFGTKSYTVDDTGVTRTGAKAINFSDVNLVKLYAGNGDNIIGPKKKLSIPFWLDAGSGKDFITGGSGNDTLNGGALNDTIHGGDGNDSIDGAHGSDWMYGNAGVDTITYANRTKDLVIDLNVIGDEGEAGENDFIISDNEKIETGSGNDLITLYFNKGMAVFAGAGNDTLLLRGAHGSIAKGGEGNDQIFAYSGWGVEIEGGGGNDFINGGNGPDTIACGGGNDQAYGGLGNDEITGNSGNDLLEGNAGNDSLNGSSGNDKLTGHIGADVLLGGEGDDYLNAQDNQGTDQLDGNAGTDQLLNDPNDTVLGN